MSGENCFALKDRLPALDIVIGDLFFSGTNRFNGELVQHAKNFCGDAIGHSSQCSQAMNGERRRSSERQASQNCDNETLELLIYFPTRKGKLIQASGELRIAGDRFPRIRDAEANQRSF